MRRAILILGLLLAAPAAFAADKTAKPAPAMPAADPEQRYIDCIAQAKSNPTDGWETALAWTGEGGGEAAEHCAAVALIGLKQYDEAAKRLEAMAEKSRDAPEMRAEMLAQAAQALILAGHVERAYADQSAALTLVPGAPDLLVDRAESLALAKNWKDALADLNAALKIDPNRAEALVYRATAKRFLDDLPGATADSDRALTLNPALVEAWLESGIDKRLAGDGEGARRCWLKVLELAPSSLVAADARRNLELLDVKP